MAIPTAQLWLDGAVQGAAIGLLASGIVLVYRSSKVINFAVANMGLVGSVLFAVLVVRYHVPYGVALVLGLLAGAVLGAIVDLAVIRRLFDAPRVIVLVATIGVAQFAQMIVTAYPNLDDYPGAPYPLPWAGSWSPTSGVTFTGMHLAIVVAVPLTAGLLALLLNRTVLGRSVKAAADNPELARLQGISPRRISTVVWAGAGALGTLCLILISAQNASVAQITSVGPTTMLRALVAALIGRMVSFPVALLAGIGVGLFETVVAYNWPDVPGLTDLLLLVVVLVVVFFVSRGRDVEASSFSFAPKVRPVPEQLRGLWWVRQLERAPLVALAAFAIVLPLVVTEPSRHLLYTIILCYAICGASVTLLTGWAGQLSLGQMAFAGLGALVAAALHRGLTFNAAGSEVTLQALPFPVAVIVAALVTAVLAAVVGAGALRVRGLLLAVSTFSFGVAALKYFYTLSFLHDQGTSTASFLRDDVFGISISSQRAYYYVVLVVLTVVMAVVARLRRSGVARTTIGVRDNPAGAAAYTVVGARVKLRAFTLAGFVAGLGGALLAGAVQNVPYSERYYLPADSLVLVSVVVIGGLGSVYGPLLGALWVVGLPSFMPGISIIPLLTSSLGLLVLLLYLPGGLVQIGYSARDALLSWVAARIAPPPVTTTATAPPATIRRRDRAPLPAGQLALAAGNIGVRFGGRAAVDGVSIEVRPDQIVGLIGTNGAGKSTLMNAIGGFVTATGEVRLLGRDLSRASSPARARAGLGRTFQSATLFPELTLRQTVQVALEARGRTGLLSTALYLPHTFSRERAQRSAADDLIDFLGLGRYADAYISDLSTGTRRIVELACLLALDARVLCLDEPTAGVAQREAEAFGPLIQEIRRELGAAMLVIEHDMPLIMGISDHVYCLEAGKVIAAGTPAEVRGDPKVIASYLGTDERSIHRSGAADAGAADSTAGPAPADEAGGRSPAGTSLPA
jgi:ABC-type branched-subunit amino acid transport system ATPase component/ABC-type branched-subunit amino acid transport system permease subunit